MTDFNKKDDFFKEHVSNISLSLENESFRNKDGAG
jgi:hypothetical protein